MNPTIDTQCMEITENDKPFIIDSPDLANWAIEKLKEERARCDLFVEAAEAKITELKNQIYLKQVQCESGTSRLLEHLDNWLDTVPAKKTKTQLSLELPAGKIVRKLPSVSLEHDDDAIISSLSGSMFGAGYIEMKPKLKWADLKSIISIVDGVPIYSVTGEVAEGIKVVEKPATIDVK